MSRVGTCRHAWQIQEMFTIPFGAQPHEKEKRVHTPHYTCEWLSTCGPLPPPLMRRAGGLILDPGDCDGCPHYEPAFDVQALLKNRREGGAAPA